MSEPVYGSDCIDDNWDEFKSDVVAIRSRTSKWTHGKSNRGHSLLDNLTREGLLSGIRILSSTLTEMQNLLDQVEAKHEIKIKQSIGGRKGAQRRHENYLERH